MSKHSPIPDRVDRETRWICLTCGVQYFAASLPPDTCPVCADDRQYVGWSGQAWTTANRLAETHTFRFERTHGVETVRLDPGFAIGQRAFLIPHAGGVMMWECLSMVTSQAVDHIRALGGLTAIGISHPHFYAAMADWSEAFGGVPVFLHEADREWLRNDCTSVEFWSGQSHALSDTLELVHLPGHFPGSAGLWWKTGPRPGGSLFPGDAIQVAMDRRRTSFMYSYPNALPLGPASLRRLRASEAGLRYEDLFGFAPGRQIIGGAKQCVAASFDRFSAALAS